MSRKQSQTQPHTHLLSDLTLTPRQIQILRLIWFYRIRHGCSPTLQEIAASLRLSKVTVFEHVESLVKKGLLHRTPNKARSLTIDSSLDPVCFDQGSVPDTNHPSLSSPSGCFPLAGTIAAGVPLEAIENPETLDLPSLFLSSEETFALRVRGDSMIQDHIRDGDFVMVRRTSTAQDGDIVVALLDDGEATLKKIYRDANGYRLEGAHPDFSPLNIDQLHIQGVVIGIVRRY